MLVQRRTRHLGVSREHASKPPRQAGDGEQVVRREEGERLVQDELLHGLQHALVRGRRRPGEEKSDGGDRRGTAAPPQREDLVDIQV